MRATSVQQKAERPATLRDQPFKSGRFLTGVPVDEKSTTDTSQHQSPPNLPVPEPFWRGAAWKEDTQTGVESCYAGLRRPRSGEGRIASSLPHCEPELIARPPLTERLCPEGFRVVCCQKRKHGRQSGSRPQRRFSLPATTTKALRRYPVPDSGCCRKGDGKSCTMVGVAPRLVDEAGPPFTTAATHWRQPNVVMYVQSRFQVTQRNLCRIRNTQNGRCGVHNRPKLRVGTVAP